MLVRVIHWLSKKTDLFSWLVSVLQVVVFGLFLLHNACQLFKSLRWCRLLWWLLSISRETFSCVMMEERNLFGHMSQLIDLMLKQLLSSVFVIWFHYYAQFSVGSRFVAFDFAELAVAVVSMSTGNLRTQVTFQAYIEIVCNHLLGSLFRSGVAFCVQDYFCIAIKLLLLLLASHLFISLQFYYLYLQILYF